MRLLLISPLPPPTGGISRWTQIVMSALKAESKYEVIYINSSPKYKGKITFFKRFFYGIFSTVSVFFSVHRKLKKGIDVVHVTTSGSMALYRDRLVLRLAKKHNAATVLHLHFGYIPEIACADNREWRNLKKAFSHCDAIISIDRETEKALICNGYMSKTYFCPNPIDIESTEKNICNRPKVNKVVFVGHIYREKGIGELVDAWLDVSKVFPDCYLELIGSTVEKEFIESLSKNSSIRFVGERTHDETMKLLSEAKMFVLPSYSEGFPNVILEAMALKVPIVATNVGAIPEMLSDGCGSLIEPKSVGELKNSMIALLNDTELGAEMAERAYRKLIEKYDVSVVISQYSNIWELVRA